jgi:hypothetical protein
MNFKLLYLCVFFNCILNAQDYSGKWEGHYSYFNITGIASSEGEVLASAQNAIFKYNRSTKQNINTSSINGLTGETISYYHYSEVYETSVIGYENGLLEVVTNDGVLTIVDILNKTSIAPNIKRVNHIYEFNGLAYISCDFGITTYNLDTLEFGDSYFIGSTGGNISVKQTTIKDNYIYAATEEGLKRAVYDSTSIIDYMQWETLNTTINNWKSVITFNDRIYAIDSANNLNYNYNGNSFDNKVSLSFPIIDHRVSDGKMLITSKTNTSIYEAPLNNIKTINTPINYDTSFTVATITDNDLFIGTTTNGILHYNLNNETLINEIVLNGPIQNNSFSVTAQNNEVWLVYGGYSVSGDPFPLNREGYSYFKDNQWVNTEYNDIIETLGVNDVTDLVAVSINPFNQNQMFISSFYSGLLEVNNGIPTKLFNNTNSNLESLGPFLSPPDPTYIDIRIGKSKFDNNGKLWLTNGRVNNAVKSYDILNNNWEEFSLENIIADPLNDENLFSDIEIDNNNNKWIATRRNGLIGLTKNNGNPIIRNITSSNGNLPINTIKALAVDNNNNLWIGTTEGLRVLYNAGRFFETNNPRTESIIILENDIAQELMFGQTITDIKVDGANNKWIATINSGVFYFSPDGQETIYHFTKNNSPLPSNEIIDMSIDNISGKIYFATSKGLVSFNSNATNSANNLDNVIVQPNPVRPNYEGNIIIKGLIDRANIKITDISGNLVDENTVKGGTYEWDQTAFGQYKVASGVYIIMITTEDGEETTVEKIMIVR